MTWTAEDIRNYQLPENRDRGPGGDYEKFHQFQQAVARVVAEQEAEIDTLRRQVHDPQNSRSVDNALDLLTKAQETVEETMREADEYSRNVRGKAREYYEQLSNQAAQVVAQANQESERIRQTIASGHGRIDAETSHALAQQQAVTDTLTAILRGLVQSLESTRASLDNLQAQAEPNPSPPASAPPESSDQFVPWSTAAASTPGYRQP